MHYLYYDEKTGWTDCEGNIDAGLMTLLEDGSVEIWSDERLHDYRIVIGQCGDDEFTLIEYLKQPIS
jgi:hypothetical protein